jgi:hypothetical protein
MRAAGLPFAVELMMGLPGATVASFKDDLQQCIDREVEGTVNPTTVLVNSPMNAPEHRARHAIETAVAVGPGAHALIIATETFTRDDYAHMGALRRTFLLGENFGVTRHLDRLVRHTTGRREIDVLEQLHRDVVDDPTIGARHPCLRALLGQRSPALVIPVSWRHLVDDLLGYVAAPDPTVDPAALATVGRVQHAVLPAFDRAYPQVVPLDHDYAAWFALVGRGQGAGPRRRLARPGPTAHHLRPRRAARRRPARGRPPQPGVQRRPRPAPRHVGAPERGRSRPVPRCRSGPGAALTSGRARRPPRTQPACTPVDTPARPDADACLDRARTGHGWGGLGTAGTRRRRSPEPDRGLTGWSATGQRMASSSQPGPTVGKHSVPYIHRVYRLGCRQRPPTCARAGLCRAQDEAAPR